jgi:hypothetical protein
MSLKIGKEISCSKGGLGLQTRHSPTCLNPAKIRTWQQWQSLFLSTPRSHFPTVLAFSVFPFFWLVEFQLISIARGWFHVIISCARRGLMRLITVLELCARIKTTYLLWGSRSLCFRIIHLFRHLVPARDSLFFSECSSKFDGLVLRGTSPFRLTVPQYAYA